MKTKEELKTLEDFKIGEYCGECGREFEVSLEPLRAEAVKWIKKLESDIGFVEEEASKGRIWIIKFIKEFFNITEQDLKEVEK